MISGLERFVSAKPGKASTLIIVLVIALLLVCASFILYASGVDLPGGSPYPNETTMLTLVDDGVEWTMDYNLIFQGDVGGRYDYIRFHWGHEVKDGYRALGGVVVDSLHYPELLNVKNASVESWIGSTLDPEGNEYSYSLVVTDAEGDGWFGFDDSIVFKTESNSDSPILEDRTYTVALAYVAGGLVAGYGEFSYAIHDGKFYSWTSYTLNWDSAWWDY